jgi:hypothetical protein
MTQSPTASQRIIAEVTSWPGVEAGPGDRGELAFKLGRREMPHPVFPDRAGPAARRIKDETDVRDVIELLRLNYDRLVARYGLPAASGNGSRP